MISLQLQERTIPVDAFVFDKDGLLFESKQFWVALAEARMEQLRLLGQASLIEKWAKCFGVRTEDNTTVLDVEPTGILAVASPAEEISATATLLVQSEGITWTEARDKASQIFLQADANLDLKRALRPRQGFPEIMRKLRELHVPYGVATSDTKQRVLDSFRMFDDPNSLSFIVSPQDVEKGKPHPDMLNLISQKLGIPVNRLAMVGDSYVDVEMARRAGAVPIGIPESQEMRSRMKEAGAIIFEHLGQIRFE